MPPKGAKKSPARKVTKTEASGSAPAAAPAPARKRARAASVDAVATPPVVDVEGSVVSVASEASLVVSVNDDDDNSRATSDANKSARRKRQTTLTGEVLDTPEKASKARRAKSRGDDAADGTAPPSETTTTTAAGGGELKPSLAPARGGSAKKPRGKGTIDDAATATTGPPVLDGPGGAPVLEAALLAHLRNALTFYAITRSRRTLTLTTTPSTAQRTDAMDAVEAAADAAEVEGEAGPPDEVVPKTSDDDEDAAVEEEEEDAAATVEESASRANVTQAFMCLPCVQYFILHECARVARVVREEGGCGYGEEPAIRAFELLGFFLNMLDHPSYFAVLLFLACPSCRTAGIPADGAAKVMEFLVLSQRAKREALVSLEPVDACVALGLLDGCRDEAGKPVEPLQCCPYGEAHVALQMLLDGLANTHGATRNCSLRFTIIPFKLEDFSAIAAAAKRYYKAYEEHMNLLEREWRQRQYQQGVDAAAAAKSTRRKHANPPQLPSDVVSLIQVRLDGRTWAEHCFSTVFPDTPLTTSTQPLRWAALQRRIRAAYAYTQADVLGRGGYFNVALHSTTSYFRSQSMRSCANEAEIVYLNYLFTFMKVFQHIAEATPHRRRGGNRHSTTESHVQQRCLCQPSTTAASPSFLLMEEHVSHIAALRRCREEQYLLVDETEERAEAALSNSQAAAVDVDGDATEEEEEEEEEEGGEGRQVARDTDDANGAVALVGGDVSYYAAGSYSRFHATLDLTQQMNATQVVDYVARATADAAEALPASAVPAAYIHAELKRHQLEDVQWMYSKETEGYREHVQVPLYGIFFHGPPEQRRPRARHTGTMSYCATTTELIVERGATATAQRAEWTTTGKCVRGGLLCDDVGLGKTLSILTLCAYDRAMQESGAVAADAAMTAPLNRYWQVSARYWVARTASLAFNTDVLRWGFGQGTFHAGTAPYTSAGTTRLPRTTLVVVPLSIAAQWIEELHKFYPSATYILFYGGKRTQYTVADLQRADFVLTTYETLSTHLRHETDGLQYWLARCADAADDAACAAAAKSGWPGCRPSHLRSLLHAFASSTVWPQLTSEADPIFHDFFRNRGYQLVLHHNVGGVQATAQGNGRGRGRGRGGRGGRGGQETANPQTVQEPVATELNAWKFQLTPAHKYPSFSCPAFTITVAASNDEDLLGEGILTGVAAPPSARQATYRRLCTGDRIPVSDAFLDDVWKLLKAYAAAVKASPETMSHTLLSGLFDFDAMAHMTENFLTLLFDSAARYPMNDSVRRLFVRHVLLPPLWRPLQKYWEAMQSHDTAVASAECTGHMPLRVLDLLFHRVVLDESQKCSATSLFHLLQGERRWAVTGTPLNNNKTESLGAALAFLGMDSAASILSQPPQRTMYYLNSWIARHSETNNYMRMMYSRMAYRVDTRFRARLHMRHDPEHVFREAKMCFCATCVQQNVYGVTAGADGVIPLECRHRWRPRQYPGGLPCLPNTLMEVLALAMVRHERNDQVSRELLLPPVQYTAHRAALTADETSLYDRVARVVMHTAARLHRQGLLSSRMGHAMQWVQELCRLCLHPARVGSAELLRGDIEAHVLRAVHFTGNNGGADPAELAAAVAATFITVTAQEALEWAQSQARSSAERSSTSSVRAPVPAADGGHVAHGVPEETINALNDLAADPPLLPLCGVCMDDMAAPTLLNCFHLFCKECLIGVIDASRSLAGNVNAKCPYCRDRKSMLDEKRVIAVSQAEAPGEEAAASATAEVSKEPSGTLTVDDVDAALARIGDGSRVQAFVELVQRIWAAEPGDGVLVFSKYPAFLQMAHDAIAAAGYAPYIVCGASSLAQRQRVMRALQQPGGASPVPHRILFVTSRSANAGLNLTFANHVIFLEPNLNPAMEQQAVGRVHRFGQLKQVTVHHLYAPRTIEEIIYYRSMRLRDQAPQQQQQQQPVQNDVDGFPVIQNAFEMQRRTQFGRIAPAEISLLLEYPVPPQQL